LCRRFVAGITTIRLNTGNWQARSRNRFEIVP